MEIDRVEWNTPNGRGGRITIPRIGILVWNSGVTEVIEIAYMYIYDKEKEENDSKRTDEEVRETKKLTSVIGGSVQQIFIH